MCHAPSFAGDDKVRGFVPLTNQPLPPAFSQEYYGPRQDGIFVRADVTYLQQDFSVPLPVANHGPWPAAQRYDFMVREREVGLVNPLQADQPRPAEPTLHQKALFFALRHLTNQDPGPAAEDWKRLFVARDKVTLLRDGLKQTGGIAADGKGNVFISDLGSGHLFRLGPQDQQKMVLEQDGGFQAMVFDAPRERLVASQTDRGRIVAIDVTTGKTTVLVEPTRDRPGHAPAFLAVDRQGGIYFTTTSRLLFPIDEGALYYFSARGTLTRLARELDHLRGLALSPDESVLYVASGSSADVLALPLESAGSPGKARVVGQLQPVPGQPMAGGNGLVIDPRSGNLYLAHPIARGVQVLNPEGARLALAGVPDLPLNCAVGEHTLYISTAHAVYRMRLEAPGQGVAREQ
jgi:sugar lactone lactonase YvrE